MPFSNRPRKGVTATRLAPILLSAVLAAATTASTQALPPAATQALPPAAQWIPKDAVISVELSRPKPLLDLLTSKEVAALPLIQQQTSNPKFTEFRNVVGFLEATLETDWRTALRKLTGGGVTLAVCPGDIVLLIVDTEDEQLLGRLHEILLGFARSEADKDGQSSRVASTQYEDVTAWTFNGKESHAIIDNRFVLSNRPEGLKTVLELRGKTADESLASNSSYQSARRAAGPDAVAAAFADMRILTQVPDIAALLDNAGGNPLAALFFAGIVESLDDSSLLALGLDVEGSKLVLRISADGKAAPDSPAAFALPKKPGEGVLPNLSVPRRIAAASLYRDLPEFYTAKDELFPERTSGLIFFENMMGIFFSGRDLTSEVLAETKPEIRLVLAEQEYDPAIGTPQVKLPAFGLVFGLHDPEQFDEVVEEAWQKAVGLINFTRGQQAMPGLIIDRPIHSENKYTMAYFSTGDAEDKTKLAQRFNFRPALATPGEYLILSSTDDLAQDQLASILRANRQTLVHGDMVKKGKSLEEAEAGIDMLITLAGLIERASLSIGTQEALMQARLELKLNLQ